MVPDHRLATTGVKGMPSPYYVSPEQIMQDKSEFVHKGIDQAKEVIVLEYKDGIVLVAENPLSTVFKISEIYDRIGFAATGLYREYESLRFVGIRDAEIKGLTYTRQDVTAKWLTNVYSQYIGGIFWQMDAKPLEVELLVCEVSEDATQSNNIYHISFDGTFWEEQNTAVIGGRSDEISQILEETFQTSLALSEAINLAAETFATIEDSVDEVDRYNISPETLEVAVLDRHQNRRKFRRLTPEEVAEISF